MIHQADPDIVESIKWNAPAFDDHGQVAWMFATKNWIHFSFPQGALLDKPSGGWIEADDTTSKAKRTLYFHQNDTIDEQLMIDLIRQAVANNKQGKKVDFGATKPGSKEFDREVLGQSNSLDAYLRRPYYQQKGYVEWIESAKTEVTRDKRIGMMLIELRHDQYMPPKSQRIHED